MQKDYWVAIAFYVVALVIVTLPFLGIVTIQSSIDFLTLKFLHIVVVFLVIASLIGQMIAFFVMEKSDITTPKALENLSLFDHVVPIGIIIIGYLGYSLASHLGPIWQHEWIYESAFGLVIYTLFSLIITVIFRRKRFYLEGGTESAVGVYVASSVAVVFLFFFAAIMVFKAVPLSTAHHFVGVTKYFTGM